MLLDVKHRKSFRLCLTGIWYGIRFRTLIHLKRQYKKTCLWGLFIIEHILRTVIGVGKLQNKV